MPARINIILIRGAAGGLGEATARRVHGLGKKVIVTGREQNRKRLTQSARDPLGLEYRVFATLHEWDLTLFETFQGEGQSILTDFPELDTVFVNAGIQNYYEIFQQPPDYKDVIQDNPNNIFLTSSSLAYFLVPSNLTYCSTKSGIAAFTKILRMQLESTGCKNMKVVEVTPPYFDTSPNAAHRDQTDALQGGKEKAVQPMPLAEYIDRFFAALENTKVDGSFRTKSESVLGPRMPRFGTKVTGSCSMHRV